MKGYNVKVGIVKNEGEDGGNGKQVSCCKMFVLRRVSFLTNIFHHKLSHKHTGPKGNERRPIVNRVVDKELNQDKLDVMVVGGMFNNCAYFEVVPQVRMRKMGM